MSDVPIRNPPPVVTALLHTVHRLLVHRRPYHEVAAALDAASAVPEATEPDAAALLALERLDAVTRYSVPDIGDEEVERVIQLTATECAALPPAERAWQLGSVCHGRPTLVLRHLVPLLEEFERQGIDDMRLLDGLREQISVARGDPQPSEDDGAVDDADTSAFPEEFIGGIRYAYRHRRMGWAYDDVMAILDEVETLPAAARFPGQLAVDRIVMTSLFVRPDADMEREIQRALRVEAHAPAWLRAMTISNACDGRPELAERYMPQLISEAEAELRDHPGDAARQYLDGAKLRLERTRAGSSRP